MRSLILWALAALPAIEAQTVSKSGRCGKKFGLSCTGSAFGNCCSSANYCGTSKDHCGTGCQTGYGTCTLFTTKKVSEDGSCGGRKGYTCLNSTFGSCCSKNGWCGSTSDYCGQGCQSGLGNCGSNTSPDQPNTKPVSKDARCGASFGGQTCSGSSYGSCCSPYSYCGSTKDHCAIGCQPGFGTCGDVSSSSSIRSSTTLLTLTSSSSLASSASLSASSDSSATLSTSSTISSSSSESSSSSSTSSTLSTSSETSTSTTSSMTSASSDFSSSSLTSSTLSTSTEVSTLVTSSGIPSSSSMSAILGSTSAPAQPSCSVRNAVADGSFESGTLNDSAEGWYTVSEGDWLQNGLVQDPIASDGKWLFRGRTTYGGKATYSILTQNTYIPSGTLVTCEAKVYYRSNLGRATTFQLSIDGTTCWNPVLRNRNELEWYRFGLPSGMSLKVNGDYHTIRIDVISTGAYGEEGTFSIDEVKIMPVGGPGAVPTCDAPVTSTNIPSSTTSSEASSISTDAVSSISSEVAPSTTSEVSPSTASKVSSTSSEASSTSSEIFASTSSEVPSSTSSELPSSTSSMISSSTNNAASSSAASSTTTSMQTSSTTSTQSSSTSSVAQTPTCIPEIVFDGGFESGRLNDGDDSWTTVTEGNWQNGVYKDTAAVRGDWLFRASTFDTTRAKHTVSIRNVRIPDGTLTQCEAWTLYRSNTASTFQILIDGNPCGGVYTLERSRNDWYGFSGRQKVVGDLHTVSIAVTSLGADAAGAIFSLDWLTIKGLTPNGQEYLKVCPV